MSLLIYLIVAGLFSLPHPSTVAWLSSCGGLGAPQNHMPGQAPVHKFLSSPSLCHICCYLIGQRKSHGQAQRQCRRRQYTVTMVTETTQDHHTFSPFPLPTRMTLYVGKDEAGFYVSKALVHTGVALVVRRVSGGAGKKGWSRRGAPCLMHDSPSSATASWTDPGPH